mgnify:CR=1 FL=1|jgi:uncharacterized lipoprotein YmbA
MIGIKVMIKSWVVVALLVTGCAAKPPKTCYELTLTFDEVHSKQVLCTDRELKESYNFRKLP